MSSARHPLSVGSTGTVLKICVSLNTPTNRLLAILGPFAKSNPHFWEKQQRCSQGEQCPNHFWFYQPLIRLSGDQVGFWSLQGGGFFETDPLILRQVCQRCTRGNWTGRTKKGVSQNRGQSPKVRLSLCFLLNTNTTPPKKKGEYRASTKANPLEGCDRLRASSAPHSAGAWRCQPHVRHLRPNLPFA